MGVDSAVWYMKLSANFNYGNASANKEDVSIQESKIPFDNTSGYFSIEDVSSMYDAIIDSVRTHYNSVGASEKALSYVNITIDTIQSATTADAYQLLITSVVTSNLVQNSFLFGPTDYWWWADGGGKCGPYSGYTGKDAMTQLEYMFQLRLPVPGNGYWLPEFTIHEVPISFPALTTPSNYCGWYLFRNQMSLPGFHECITPSEMNFYLNGLELIGNTLLPQKWGFYGQGFYCISVDIYRSAKLFQNYIGHEVYFLYGTPHNGDPGGEL